MASGSGTDAERRTLGRMLGGSGGKKKSDHATSSPIRNKNIAVYIHSKPNFTLGGKEEGRLWDLEQAVLTALAHGVSCAIFFRNILRGR